MFNRLQRWILIALVAIFSIVYLGALIGIAFVRPPFQPGWTGNSLFLLEGVLLLLAAIPLYGWKRTLTAWLVVLAIAYLLEALSTHTSLPFGAYRYTDILQPQLPGQIPLPMLSVWLLSILGAYSWLYYGPQRNWGQRIATALLGATLATLLKLALEPVAARIVDFQVWLQPGSLTYYGIPLANFVSWFVISFVLLLLLETLSGTSIVGNNRTKALARFIPRMLFAASVLLFGVIDLTYGYYEPTLFAVIAGVALWGAYRRQSVQQTV